VWHGIQIPAEWIEKKSDVDPSLALTWKNIEQRRCLSEILGWSKVLEQLKPKTIDEDEDPEIGKLVEVNLPDVGKARFLVVRCGTGRIFALCVPNETKSAAEGNAWTYGIDTESLNQLEVRT
jgi:hypothetical protein